LSKKYLFHREKTKSNPYRVFVILILVLGGLFLLRGYGAGQVTELFKPTPTPTRTTNSYALEGQTHFQAGNLDKAIAAYKAALETNPKDADIWLELARIQTYSSSQLTTLAEKRARRQEALDSANQAVKLAPDSSSAQAVRAFVLDWVATLQDDPKQRDALLAQAEQAVTAARGLDKNNVLALAYSAEIYNDNQKYDLAQSSIDLAKQLNENLMDVQRVRAGILESRGDYQGAIDAYTRAIEISPNLTFLYVQAGVLYRHLGNIAKSSAVQKEYYNKALDLFAKAVALDKQLAIKDPNPYIAIGKVYTQMGEFFVASRNTLRAVQIDPSNPDLYGELGMVYFHARNYETSIPALQCAIEGCGPEISCQVRDDCSDPGVTPITIKGITLEASDATTIVYYYTYGSVLAGLYRPVGETSTYCDKALKILAKVRAVASNDATVMSIVSASESVCTYTKETPTANATTTGKTTATATLSATSRPTPTTANK
jgi:tetratricopeptide (TPR) repeat protein